MYLNKTLNAYAIESLSSHIDSNQDTKYIISCESVVEFIFKSRRLKRNWAVS